MTHRIGSLFSGYGGLDLGVMSVLDAELTWVSDLDPGPCKVLAHRHPNVPNLGDITAIDWADVPPVDILTGGFPCQDLSLAGKRAGLRDGTRSGLWGVMVQAIHNLQPRLVVIENVRGLLSADAYSEMESCPRCVGNPDGGPVLRALGRVLGDLADLGYDAAWYGLRAADIGAPHGRFRIFIVAAPANADDAGRGEQRGAIAVRAEQPSAEHGRPDAVTLLPTPTASDTNGAGSHGAGGLDLRTTVALLPTQAVNDMGAGKTVEDWDAWTAKMQAKHGNGNGHGKSLAIEAARLLPTPRATDGNKGGPNQRGSKGDLTMPSAVQPAKWGDYAAAIHRWEAIHGTAPAPTEPGRSGTRLNPAFVEWMMGLPAGWVTDVPGLTRNQQLKLLGNGVVPQQAAAAVHWLLVGGPR